MTNPALGPWVIPGINKRLKDLHARKGPKQLSMSQIRDILNAEFKTSLTRNAIVGRCHRMVLAARPSPLGNRFLKPKAKAMKTVKVDAPIVPLEALLPDERPQSGLTIYQTGNGDCKWPLGKADASPPFLYCGDPVMDDRPYCGTHCGIAYNVPRRLA